MPQVSYSPKKKSSKYVKRRGVNVECCEILLYKGSEIAASYLIGWLNSVWSAEFLAYDMQAVYVSNGHVYYSWGLLFLLTYPSELMLVNTFFSMMTLIFLAQWIFSPQLCCLEETAPGSLLRFWFPLSSTHTLWTCIQSGEKTLLLRSSGVTEQQVGSCCLPPPSRQNSGGKGLG